MGALLEIIRKHRKAYLVLNAVYYGLVILAMVYIYFNPNLQETLLAAVGQTFEEGGILGAVGEAYSGGQVVSATLLTFVVNLFIGSLLSISVPSLVIPFSGLLLGVYRAVLWGLMLSPAYQPLVGPMIPHALTLILEGQAYIVAMLGVYIHGRYFLWPAIAGVEGRGRGYLAGLKASARLYVLVALLLAIAAVYEVLEVIFLVPLLA